MCINLWNSLYLADPYIPPVVTRGSYIPVVNIGSSHGASRTKSGPSKKPCTYSKPKCLLGDPFAFIPGDIFIEAWNCKHILVLLANSTGKRGSPACSMSRCCRPKSPPPRCAVRSPRDGFWSHKAATSQTPWAIGTSTLPRVDQSVDPLTSPRCPTTWGPSASTKSTPAWTGGRTRSTKPINIVQSVLKSLDQPQSNLLGEESMLGRRIQRSRSSWIFILDYNILPRILGWCSSFGDISFLQFSNLRFLMKSPKHQILSQRQMLVIKLFSMYWSNVLETSIRTCLGCFQMISWRCERRTLHEWKLRHAWD